MMQILLTDKSFWNNLNFTQKLQSNLAKLYKITGDKFFIVHKRHKMPVYFFKIKTTFGYPSYGIKYGALRTPKYLFPFMINMYYNVDGRSDKDVNDVYITNFSAIRKGDYPDQSPISGTNVIEMIILFMRNLRVENIYLNDGAHIECDGTELTLSPIKLLEKGRSFYMKFGFKPEIDCNSERRGHYKDINKIIKAVDKTIAKIKQIDTYYIHKFLNKMINLVDKIYKNNDFDDVVIYRNRNEYLENVDYGDNEGALEYYKGNCVKLREILPREGNLSKWMIDSLANKCENLATFNLVFDVYFSEIKYRGKYYEIIYQDFFNDLNIYNDMIFRLEL